MISGNKLQSASAVCTGISMPLTKQRATCIGEIYAYVNTGGHVVSSTKKGIHKAGRMYSHFGLFTHALSPAQCG